MSDSVNHPAHYNAHPAGVECIDVIEWMPANCANAFKYLWRCDLKHPAPDEDLRKAIWYLEREIARREKYPACVPVAAAFRDAMRRRKFTADQVCGAFPDRIQRAMHEIWRFVSLDGGDLAGAALWIICERTHRSEAAKA